jgi:hypothetical protein
LLSVSLFEVTCIPWLFAISKSGDFAGTGILGRHILKAKKSQLKFVVLVGGKGCFGVWPKHNP